LAKPNSVDTNKQYFFKYIFFLFLALKCRRAINKKQIMKNLRGKEESFHPVALGTMLILVFLLVGLAVGLFKDGDSATKSDSRKTDSTKANASEDLDHLLSNQDRLNILVSKGDLEGCKELDMPQFRLSCETNILANRATSNRDVPVCDKASTDEAKTHCQRLVSNKTF
jgi:hypothetical protein